MADLLVSKKSFDPDVEVCLTKSLNCCQLFVPCLKKCSWFEQDASGWTPLMIASSLREEDGLVDLLLSKDAEVDIKSTSVSAHPTLEAKSWLTPNAKSLKTTMARLVITLCIRLRVSE